MFHASYDAAVERSRYESQLSSCAFERGHFFCSGWCSPGDRHALPVPVEGRGFSPHSVDVVIVTSLRLIYVDNAKAGSSLIRSVLLEHADASWDCSDRWRAIQGCCTEANLRTTSSCIGPEHSDFLVFSFVRNPVSKFESGVRQAWFQNPDKFSGKDADTMLRDILAGKGWANEHLQPSSYRLSGRTRDDLPVQLHFIGRLESIVHDWTSLLQSWAPEFLEKSLPAMSEHVNSRDREVGSMLSPEMVCAFCKSELFGHDVALFDYGRACAAEPQGTSICNCT